MQRAECICLEPQLGTKLAVRDIVPAELPGQRDLGLSAAQRRLLKCHS